MELGDKLAAVATLAIVLFCFWLLLWHGIPGHMEQLEKRNAKLWEATR
jgi:hypothetical protein